MREFFTMNDQHMTPPGTDVCPDEDDTKRSTRAKNSGLNHFWGPKGGVNPSGLLPADSTPAEGDPLKNKSLFDRFTGEDAVTGEPVSRWVACSGRVPGAEDAVGEREIPAKFNQKIAGKPGKLGTGRSCPKHPRFCDEHCHIVLVSGEGVLAQTDFELPGPIPLHWRHLPQQPQQGFRPWGRMDIGMAGAAGPSRR